MNAIRIIRPYKYYGQWVFDDPEVGLLREAFVAGADTLIDKATADIPKANKGFLMLFSETAFPGAEIELKWVREESDGNVYYCEALDGEGWLCPALFKYFKTAPRQIFVQVKPAHP